LPKALLVASTTRIEASGATACAHCTSSAVSRAHVPSTRGSRLPPVWLTTRSDGGAASPNVRLNTARSAARSGASYAETMAMVSPAPVPVSPRWLRTCAGV
jgi:hypothetical protein